MALIGPPPSFPSKSIQSPACGPRRVMTQEPVLRGASPRILARRHSSPTRLPFGKRRGTQLLCCLAQALDDQVEVIARGLGVCRSDIVEIDHNSAHWNAPGGTTPPNQLQVAANGDEAEARSPMLRVRNDPEVLAFAS
jgi:hypothetical protein